MDEQTFQTELAQLKQHVGQMYQAFERQQAYPTANNLPRGPPSPSTPADAFSTRLDELRGRLSELQVSMGQQAQSFAAMPSQYQLPSSGAGWGGGAPSQPQHMHATSLPAADTTEFALPSGPRFWDLVNSLRNELCSVNSRVADVEHSVSELDDRLESLEPKRFTPTSSVLSTQEQYDLPDEEAECDRFDTIVDTDEGAMSSDNGLHDVEKALDDMEKNLGDARKGLDEAKRSRVGKAASQCSCMDFQAGAAKRALQEGIFTHASPSFTKPYRSGDEPAPGAHNSTTSASEEGVVFRDNEILRLEELLRDAHEKLTTQEDIISARKNEIDQLQDDYEHRIRANEKQFYAKCDDAQREEQNTGVALQANRRLLKERTMLEGRVSDLEQALYKAREASRAEDEDFDRVIATKDEEIRRLSEFCEQKDFVASEQEAIIARGAGLLEQRDDYIERLENRLRRHEEDATHDAREADRLLHDAQSRNRSLLGKLDELQADLKRREDVELHVKEEAERNKQPWAFAVERARLGDPSKKPLRWSLSQDVDFGKRTPYEQARASLWGSEKPSEKPRMANDAQASSPAGSKSRYRRGSGSKRDSQGRSDNRGLTSKRPGSPPHQGQGHGPPLEEQHAGTSKHLAGQSWIEDFLIPSKQPSSHRTKNDRKLADPSLQPPLPAPTRSLNHSQSMATMRPPREEEARRRDGKQNKSLSRHQSLQHLPKRRTQPHQAYVETETESDAREDV